MTKTEVLALLRENQNERGIEHWNRPTTNRHGLKSFGIGLTVLRKLAKKVGRDHDLAQDLWETDVYDAKVMGLLIDDPKKLSREQAEEQVEQLHGGYFAHVFASCDATLAKTPFAFEVAQEWMASEDDMRRRCGYSLLYELSKKNPKGMDDTYLLERIEHIRTRLLGEVNQVRGAMGGALMGVGKRNKTLNAAAIRAAKEIGPIETERSDGSSCEPFNVLKHLTSDYIRKKLGT